jgi:hypothetical protein
MAATALALKPAFASMPPSDQRAARRQFSFPACHNFGVIKNPTRYQCGDAGTLRPSFSQNRAGGMSGATLPWRK